MEKLTLETKEIMNERFGKDNIIAIATLKDGEPYVRNVNGFYEDGAFYVITYALSNKMKQIEENPHVAIADDWFTAHGKGINLGWFCKEEKIILSRLNGYIIAKTKGRGNSPFVYKAILHYIGIFLIFFL